ncbi:hypothetical protein LCGC14_0680340 [marine sediment metagenome]|uniref:Uncharacterized protein n=1 Tax=marine sediment metagenome TaxID=412755 RepID=A0A0F9T9S2_9ZZZZ
MTLFPTELDELQGKVSILELEREFHVLTIRRLEAFISVVEKRLGDIGGSFQSDDAAWEIQTALDKLKEKE